MPIGSNVGSVALPDRLSCTRCQLSARRRNVVPNQVVPNCKILFIAEAPGQDEDAAGTTPLVGRAGKYFRSVATQLGVNLNECSLLNTVQCRPPGNRDPKPEEMEACRPFFEHDITEANPDVIVVMGAVAAAHVALWKKPITKAAGTVVSNPRYPGKPIVLCVHPSAVLRNKGNTEPFLRGIRKAAEMAGYHVAETEDTNYRVVQNRADFEAMVTELEAAPVFAIDTETTGLDNLWDGYMLCLAYSTQIRTGWIIPRYETHGDTQAAYLKTVNEKGKIDNYEQFLVEKSVPKPILHPVWKEADLVDRLRKVHADPKKLKGDHNHIHEYKWTRREGLPLEAPIADTMVGHYLCDGTKNTHGLAYLSEVILKMPPFKKQSTDSLLRDGDSFGFMPRHELYARCVRDADACFRLIAWEQEFMRSVDEDQPDKPMTQFWIHVLGDATAFLSEIEAKGIGFDMDRSQNIVQPHYEKLQAEALAELTAAIPAGVPLPLTAKKEPGWGSTKAMTKFLYEDLKFPVPKDDFDREMRSLKTGNPSTSKEAIEAIAMNSDSQVPKRLLKFKKYPHARSNFIVGFQKRVRPDNRIHGHFHLHTVDTGRLSSTDPNTQNVKNTAEDQGDVGLKSQFIPSEGRVFIEADYSKAEIIVAAEESADPKMVEAIQKEAEQIANGVSTDDIVDFHDYTAMNVMGVPFEKRKDKDIRKRAKRGTFCVLYGGTARTLAKQAGCSLAEAEDFIANFERMYPRYIEWRNWVIDMSRQYGYVTTRFGRRRFLPDIYSLDKQLREAAERQAGNTPIQATASDLTLIAAMRIRKELAGKYDFDTVDLIHDSILWEVAQSQVYDFSRDALILMEQPPKMRLPLRAEFATGVHWGDMKEIERKLILPAA